MALRDYLTWEDKRNSEGHKVFKRFFERAVGVPVDVVVGHHIIFIKGGDDAEPNEVPSADTVLFDHDLMGAVFGDKALPIMLTLAKRTPELRERVLNDQLDALDLAEGKTPPVIYDKRETARLVAAATADREAAKGTGGTPFA